ncbi:hypothetical protein [Sporomusa sp.]|uniref:hypothetical protein n=1 Tax=Sporomusa sp. TaxID=2078658 RepID=UPI002BE9E26C|nr:hypothetical protein [Sporomusa sp.]HWR45027.1 hypothetical protein [Sporomusa sp.]
MAKIKKNLSDSEMLKGWHEQPTFETDVNDEQPVQSVIKVAKKEPAEDINSAFFTPELKEAVGKALLELKLNLYKEGIVDYQVKVSCQGHQVLLTAVPPKAKSPSNQPVHQGGRSKG